jgi:hypothetical protein
MINLMKERKKEERRREEERRRGRGREGEGEGGEGRGRGGEGEGEGERGKIYLALAMDGATHFTEVAETKVASTMTRSPNLHFKVVVSPAMLLMKELPVMVKVSPPALEMEVREELNQ